MGHPPRWGTENADRSGWGTIFGYLTSAAVESSALGGAPAPQPRWLVRHSGDPLGRPELGENSESITSGCLRSILRPMRPMCKASDPEKILSVP